MKTLIHTNIHTYLHIDKYNTQTGWHKTQTYTHTHTGIYNQFISQISESVCVCEHRYYCIVYGCIRKKKFFSNTL